MNLADFSFEIVEKGVGVVEAVGHVSRIRVGIVGSQDALVSSKEFKTYCIAGASGP
jgi:hypothetical protein